MLLLEQVEQDMVARMHEAVDRGADLLGVAGGDGTLGLVADVAAERRVPLLVIPAGTRNHFALDLGLDRARPDKALDALTDGAELVVDLGVVGTRSFVNNVSFGACAQIVGLRTTAVASSWSRWMFCRTCSRGANSSTSPCVPAR